jgi:hypothetical protein
LTIIFLLTERSLEMKRAIFWPIILGLLGFGLFFTSVALAAPTQPAALPGETGALFQDPVTPTVTVTPTVEPPSPTVTPTTTTTHPVASALAKYFDVPYSEIETLHQEGYGFGVIAKAYFAAQKLDITPTELLDKFDSGMGWGQIMKEYGLHPGQAGRGGNLGGIMSGHAQNNQSLDSMGAGHTPPGQLKKGQPSDEGDNEAAGDDLGHGNGHGKGHQKQK